MYLIDVNVTSSLRSL